MQQGATALLTGCPAAARPWIRLLPLCAEFVPEKLRSIYAPS